MWKAGWKKGEQKRLGYVRPCACTNGTSVNPEGLGSAVSSGRAGPSPSLGCLPLQDLRTWFFSEFNFHFSCFNVYLFPDFVGGEKNYKLSLIHSTPLRRWGNRGGGGVRNVLCSHCQPIFPQIVHVPHYSQHSPPALSSPWLWLLPFVSVWQQCLVSG